MHDEVNISLEQKVKMLLKIKFYFLIAEIMAPVTIGTAVAVLSAPQSNPVTCISLNLSRMFKNSMIGSVCFSKK